MENAYLFEVGIKKEKNEVPLYFPNNWDSKKSEFLSKRKTIDDDIASALDNILYHFFIQKKHCILQGAAGTGKTTVLQHIMEYHDNKTIAFLAPTNEAKAILENKLDALQNKHNKQYNYLIATVHSGLGCILLENEEGEPEFCITNAGRLAHYNPDYIIIDEASMLTEKLHDALIALNKPVLFVGDKNQLPPVGDDFSVFKKPYHTITLLQKKRFKNEKLKEFTDYLETAIATNADFMSVMFEAIKYKDVISFVNRHEKHEYDAYVGYTNEGGKFEFLKKNNETYVVGKRYYTKGFNANNLTKGEKYLLVNKAEKHIEEQGKKYKYYELTLKGNHEDNHTILAWSSTSASFFKDAKKKLRKWNRLQKEKNKIQNKTTIALFETDEFLREEIKKRLEEAKKDCPYQNVDVIKNITEIYPEDIYTVHASQGKTFGKVLVDAYSFRYAKGNKEQIKSMLLKLMYVACTRASDKLLVYAYVPN